MDEFDGSVVEQDDEFDIKKEDNNWNEWAVTERPRIVPNATKLVKEIIDFRKKAIVSDLKKLRITQGLLAKKRNELKWNLKNQAAIEADIEVLEKTINFLNQKIAKYRKILDDFAALVTGGIESRLSRRIAKRYGYDTCEAFYKSRDDVFDASSVLYHFLTDSDGILIRNLSQEETSSYGYSESDLQDVLSELKTIIPASFADKASRHK